MNKEILPLTLTFSIHYSWSQCKIQYLQLPIDQPYYYCRLPSDSPLSSRLTCTIVNVCDDTGQRPPVQAGSVGHAGQGRQAPRWGVPVYSHQRRGSSRLPRRAARHLT